MPREDRHPRRRRPPEERREAILAAATEAFASAPYNTVAVAGIAAAAGASEALVFRYFAGKPGLYVEVVRRQLDSLVDRREAVLAALPPNTCSRDRIRVLIEATLDHVRGNAGGWPLPHRAAPAEPEPARQLRIAYRAAFVDHVAAQLRRGGQERDRLATVGFVGFLDAAAADWSARQCPAEDREPLVACALGALEGALGDWGG